MSQKHMVKLVNKEGDMKTNMTILAIINNYIFDMYGLSLRLSYPMGETILYNTLYEIEPIISQLIQSLLDVLNSTI